jgi:hypothetical protein
MVQAEIWGDKIINPYFFDGNVTGEMYPHMLIILNGFSG